MQVKIDFIWYEIFSASLNIFFPAEMLKIKI